MDGVSLNVGGINELMTALRVMPSQLAEINRRTISDIRDRAPGKIGSATSKIYRIDKSYVVALRARRDEAVEYHRGRNSGKGNVRFGVGGREVSTATLVFKAASNPWWPTKPMGGKMNEMPPKKPRKKRFKGKSVTPFYVKIETLRGKPAYRRTDENHRIFVLPHPSGKGLRVMSAEKGSRRFLTMKTSSMPQAILNEKVVDIWRPQVQDLIVKRWQHHERQVLKQKSSFTITHKIAV